MTIMLELENVSVTIDRKAIVSGVTLAAEAGKVSLVIGPNGSGKSTLLKAISGDLAYGGSIRLNGQEISTCPAAEAAAKRAVMPQAAQLSFPFTVREVVSIGARAGSSGLHGADLQHLPEKALQRVDLEHYGKRMYQELSGGEQQRVQLARVLAQVWMPVHHQVPRLLLLDEPVSSLDLRHQIAIMKIAQDFARAGGGVVAIVHDLNLAAMFADRIAVMSKGRMVASGAPQDVLQDAVLEPVFGIATAMNKVPDSGMPFILPQCCQAR
jgi:iron complex transport system ATP-binding protein